MSGDALLEKLRHVTVYLTGDADAKLYTVQPNPPSFSYSGTPNCWSHFLNFKIWQLFELNNTVWPISRYNTVQISKRGDPPGQLWKKMPGKEFQKKYCIFHLWGSQSRWRGWGRLDSGRRQWGGTWGPPHRIWPQQLPRPRVKSCEEPTIARSHCI